MGRRRQGWGAVGAGGVMAGSKGNTGATGGHWGRAGFKRQPGGRGPAQGALGVPGRGTPRPRNDAPAPRPHPALTKTRSVRPTAPGISISGIATPPSSGLAPSRPPRPEQAAAH